MSVTMRRNCIVRRILEKVVREGLKNMSDQRIDFGDLIKESKKERARVQGIIER